MIGRVFIMKGSINLHISVFMLLSGTWMPCLLHLPSNFAFFWPMCGVSSGIFLWYLALSMMMIVLSMFGFLYHTAACASIPQSMHDWTFHNSPLCDYFRLQICQGCRAVIPLFARLWAQNLGRCGMRQQWQKWNSSADPYIAQLLWGLARHLDHTSSPHSSSNSYEYISHTCI